MGSVFGPPVLILAAGGMGLLVLWRAGAWAPLSVQRFRRLARRNGIVLQGPVSERLVARAPLLKNLQGATDIQSLLGIAGRRETPTAWALGVLGIALVATVALLVLDLVSWAINGRLSFPPAVCFLFGLLWLALGYIRLRNAALRRQQALGTALDHSFTELAMLTYTRQIPIEAALEDVIAPSQLAGHLRGLFADESWRRLVRFESVGLPEFERQLLASHTAIYEGIASSFGVPAFHVLATNMRRVNDKGQTPSEVLTNLAALVAENELGDMMVRSEQARARQALPVGLLVIPLLVLIGFPLIAGLARVFS
jgi:Flp pilus assembly protein TadB